MWRLRHVAPPATLYRLAQHCFSPASHVRNLIRPLNFCNRFPLVVWIVGSAQVVASKTRHNLHGLDMLAAPGAAGTAFFVTSLAHPIPVVDDPSPTDLTPFSLISYPYHFYALTAHQPVVIRKLPERRERHTSPHFLTSLAHPIPVIDPSPTDPILPPAIFATFSWQQTQTHWILYGFDQSFLLPIYIPSLYRNSRYSDPCLFIFLALLGSAIRTCRRWRRCRHARTRYRHSVDALAARHVVPPSVLSLQPSFPMFKISSALPISAALSRL
jgi:hypothetical protein